MKVKNKDKKPEAKGFSEFEREALKERAQEILGKREGENAILAKIAEMPATDKTMAKRIHEIIKDVAPSLIPKTWYGMPAYANKEGKVICFFQSAYKFKARYATFGFNDNAKLDDGNLWPTSFALKKLTPSEEIDSVLKKAESKIWYGHPVWFLDGNPIVGYQKLKDSIRLLFWSGQSFDEKELTSEGSFKAAEIRFTNSDQIKVSNLHRWLKKASKIQWDYKNIIKRKGKLIRL